MHENNVRIVQHHEPLLNRHLKSRDGLRTGRGFCCLETRSHGLDNEVVLVRRADLPVRDPSSESSLRQVFEILVFRSLTYRVLSVLGRGVLRNPTRFSFFFLSLSRSHAAYIGRRCRSCLSFSRNLTV